MVTIRFSSANASSANRSTVWKSRKASSSSHSRLPSSIAVGSQVSALWVKPKRSRQQKWNVVVPRRSSPWKWAIAWKFPSPTAASASVDGKFQGFLRCACVGQCKTNRCSCVASNVKCNSRCHQGHKCANVNWITRAVNWYVAMICIHNTVLAHDYMISCLSCNSDLHKNSSCNSELHDFGYAIQNSMISTMQFRIAYAVQNCICSSELHDFDHAILNRMIFNIACNVYMWSASTLDFWSLCDQDEVRNLIQDQFQKS